MITDDHRKIYSRRKLLGRASKNRCMVEKLFQKIFLVADEWRNNVVLTIFTFVKSSLHIANNFTFASIKATVLLNGDDLKF